METQATAGASVRWALAGLTGLALFYGLLLSALAARAAAVLPADAQRWFTAMGRL